MREQVRHVTGAAIFDVVMDRMGIAARGLERGEYCRGLGPARNHKALAEHKILEPALLGHHAMLCGIELGHGGFSCGLCDAAYRYRTDGAATIGSIRLPRSG